MGAYECTRRGCASFVRACARPEYFSNRLFLFPLSSFCSHSSLSSLFAFQLVMSLMCPRHGTNLLFPLRCVCVCVVAGESGHVCSFQEGGVHGPPSALTPETGWQRCRASLWSAVACPALCQSANAHAKNHSETFPHPMGIQPRNVEGEGASGGMPTPEGGSTQRRKKEKDKGKMTARRSAGCGGGRGVR